MEEQTFRRFMKRSGKSESTIQEALVCLRRFSEHLTEVGSSLDSATENNLEEYAAKIADERMIRTAMHSLHYCFEFMGRHTMTMKANQLRSRYLKRPPFRLKDFIGVPSDAISKLNGAGLHNLSQMLEDGKTMEQRRDLSKKLEIPLNVIVEIVKMSDLARIFGLKAIRARLYHDSGVDTIEKMSSMNSEELIRLTSSYIKRSNFNGVPPTPKEAEFTIKEAKRIIQLLEW